MPSSLLWNPASRWLATKLNGITSHVPPPPPEDGSPKRKMLLVHAHPLASSYSSALAAAVEEGARAGGHELRRISLYDQNYGVKLTASERAAYFETTRPERLASDVRRALTDLSWCDSVVFVYPTWWFNVPAALKGFFDRTFQPGSSTAGAIGAWEFPPTGCDAAGEGASSTGLRPLLTNVKRVAAVSTYGAPQHIAFLAGDNGRNCIATAIRHGAFAPDCTCLWLGLYAIDSTSEQARAPTLPSPSNLCRPRHGLSAGPDGKSQMLCRHLG